MCASVYNTNINLFRLSSQPSGITVVLCIMVYTWFIHGFDEIIPNSIFNRCGNSNYIKTPLTNHSH